MKFFSKQFSFHFDSAIFDYCLKSCDFSAQNSHFSANYGYLATSGVYVFFSKVAIFSRFHASLGGGDICLKRHGNTERTR